MNFPCPPLSRPHRSISAAASVSSSSRFHATLEQGGTWFEDDQTLYQSGGVNYGNSHVPIFGQTLYLTDLLGPTARTAQAFIAERW